MKLNITRDRFIEIFKSIPNSDLIYRAFEEMGTLFQTDSYIFHWESDVSIISKECLDTSNPVIINWYKLYHLGRCLNITGIESEYQLRSHLINIVNDLLELFKMRKEELFKMRKEELHKEQEHISKEVRKEQEERFKEYLKQDILSFYPCCIREFVNSEGYNIGFRNALSMLISNVKEITDNHYVAFDESTNDILYSHEDGTYHELLNEVRDELIATLETRNKPQEETPGHEEEKERHDKIDCN